MRGEDISGILARWPFDTTRVQARMLKGKSGAPIIQLRVDMGLIQMRRDGSPDGRRRGGFSSILGRYRALAKRIAERGRPPEDLQIPAEDFAEIDRELLQYHHRRMALMSLGDYERAARDAEHSLALLRLVQRHCVDEGYVAAHERSVPLVILERTRAWALLALRRKHPRAAVVHIEKGIRLIGEHVQEASAEAGSGTVRELAFLRKWSRRLRRAHGLEPPLELQLENAVRREDYEEAARLRDEIRRRRAAR